MAGAGPVFRPVLRKVYPGSAQGQSASAAQSQVDAKLRVVQWFFMSRLSRYLVVQYARDTIALFAVAAILVWLMQMLRLFDLVTAKGQGMITLAGQALLTTPPLAREIAYICMAIGLARAFKALQDSRELHSIHIMQRVTAIWSALLVYAVVGSLFALVLAHWGEPAARRASSEWRAQIAAELLGQNLTPGRFTEVASGVVLNIGGRLPDGTITDFFADDTRQEDIRRTYFADAATIVHTDIGFQISLRDGRLQILPVEGKYSEIEFARYELALDSLTEDDELDDTRAEMPTWDLIKELDGQSRSARIAARMLHQRAAEVPRVLAICLLVAALLSFPHARRGREMLPFEFIILVISFSERSLSNYLLGIVDYGAYFGPVVMTIGSAILLILRFRSFFYGPRERQSAHPVPA